MKRNAKGLAIKQQRGQRTYDALVEAGFKLMEKYELDNISVHDLAREAGYSTGAFYGRFTSKEQFFEVMVSHHLEKRSTALDPLFERLPMHKLVPELINNIIDYYWQHRRFWRAVQIQNIRNMNFARRFRDNFNYRAQTFIDYTESQVGRRLTAKEKENISFAFQLLLGTVNNATFNESGTVLLGQKKFKQLMLRAFLEVSGIKDLK